MDTVAVSEILRNTLSLALKLGGPILILCMAVGVIIAIFQAVTQIHEQTLGFILKLVVLVLVLVIAGGWMFQLLQEFTLQLFGIIAA